jgi:hypothetical protein
VGDELAALAGAVGVAGEGEDFGVVDEAVDTPTGCACEAAFAALCAACPIPASSGKTDRHRLNSAGDRAANHALHLIAVVRMRWCPKTRAYLTRRTAEGFSKKDIIRCLKRQIAREVHHAIQADLATLHDRLAPKQLLDDL